MLDLDVPPEEEGETDGAVGAAHLIVAGSPVAATASSTAVSTPPRWITVIEPP